MELNDLLTAAKLSTERTLVLRHRPSQPRFRKALPLLAADRLDLFNAYQAYQSENVERSLIANEGGWLASFISYGAGKAVFVGIYEIGSSIKATHEQFWRRPENIELRTLGNPGFTDDDERKTIHIFDLSPTSHYANWRGKLIVRWPPPERGWYRRAHKNVMPILAIREESAFAAALPAWDEVEFTWAELGILPSRWRAALEQWRGIYLIWDEVDGKSYVGCAYGATNILGRWENYAASGHGGNQLLKKRDPNRFRFSILQRVSPDLEYAEVVRLESAWKSRLHTREPQGLNEN